MVLDGVSTPFGGVFTIAHPFEYGRQSEHRFAMSL